MTSELDKAQAFGVQGEARLAALAACREQLAAWGVALPPGEPLVSDFGLDDFARTGLIEFWIANELTAGYCGKYLFVFNGQSCPEHAHRVKHETFFLMHGQVRMTIDGEARTLAPGALQPVPPGTRHSFTGLGAALLLEVSQPCIVADNYFSDPRIPIGGAR